MDDEAYEYFDFRPITYSAALSLSLFDICQEKNPKIQRNGHVLRRERNSLLEKCILIGGSIDETRLHGGRPPLDNGWTQ